MTPPVEITDTRQQHLDEVVRRLIFLASPSALNLPFHVGLPSRRMPFFWVVFTWDVRRFFATLPSSD